MSPGSSETERLIETIHQHAAVVGPPLSEARVDQLGISDTRVRSIVTRASSFTTRAGMEIDLTASLPPTPWPELGERVLADNGAGDLWTVDVDRNTGVWQSVFHVCHDPPIFFRQFYFWTDFISGVLTTSKFEDSTMQIVYRLESADLGISIAKARESSDGVLRTFAGMLETTATIYDLRGAPGAVGFDHSTGDPLILRYDSSLVFAKAFQNRPADRLWSRLIKKLLLIRRKHQETKASGLAF